MAERRRFSGRSSGIEGPIGVRRGPRLFGPPQLSLRPVDVAPTRAITRRPGRRVGEGQVTFLSQVAVDLTLAADQHRAYEERLCRCGLTVESLPADDDLPDSVFVEDTAVVLPEIAVLARPASDLRRAEVSAVQSALRPHRDRIDRIARPARLEGGDVVTVGRRVFVGLSGRTNQAGVDQLSEILWNFDYEVIPVEVTRCLHLKTAVTYLGDNTVVINQTWIDASPLRDFEWLEVECSEPFGANTLTIEDLTLVPKSCPRTQERIETAGFRAVAIGMSEFEKVEAGLTCCSLFL